MMWDLRTNKPEQSIAAHQKEVNALSFNPFNEWILATASGDATIKLFDMRKLSRSLHTFDSHDGEDDFYGDSAAGYIDTLKKNITQGEWTEQVSRAGQDAARTRLHVQTCMFRFLLISFFSLCENQLKEKRNGKRNLT
ncbi:uncharacterized protein [Miscanthus floridulus]|uniref:uncharacterized protein isoform X2 n=1 Tax=Miscanthus floridulus TaxID=154761 RepID=UPI003459D239